ncbi:MAG: PEGA domain-containing protein [Candidatus Aminicenantes bacterium]|nr:PEGA domain-containing protein [Candidatus Aminicenantes bacterium]
MKKIRFLLLVLFFISLGVACTIHFPFDMLDDYEGVTVVMKIVPDDADVLLNGRFIGVAYEFSTPGSALRLASRLNELVFKKEGYREESVDLRTYASRNITLRLNLEERSLKAAPETPAKNIPAEENDEAYKAQNETPPPLPVAEKTVPEKNRFLATIILTVAPAETALYIDGKFWGVAPETGKIENLRLEPGKYLFEAFKPGYKNYKKEISVPKQEKFSLDIALQK